MFDPTPEQAEAVDRIIDWFREQDPDCLPKFYVLKGYAGTGKTYLMTHLARTGMLRGNMTPEIWGRIRPDQIIFTAPTNKAVKVLRNYLDGAGLQACPTKTIFALLGLALQTNGELRELKKHGNIDLKPYKLIVVDEASMVNRFLMEAIDDMFTTWGIPVLFMGDPAQLPPVGEPYTPVWDIPYVSELTQVMRYGDSMLDLATSIRKVVDHPFPSVRVQTKPPVHRVDKATWFKEIVANLDLFKTGDAKVIAWRNETVVAYNNYIREYVFGKAEARRCPWLPGDKLIAADHLKGWNNEVLMRTDEEATVNSVSISKLAPGIEAWTLQCRGEQDEAITLWTPTNRGSAALGRELEHLRATKSWRAFWSLKDAFHEIRHAYALTTHRSQGSSYRKTFVDLQDIMLNRNRSEAFRSLYVACTRQREEIWIS